MKATGLGFAGIGSIGGMVVGALAGLVWYTQTPANFWMSTATGMLIGLALGLNQYWRVERVLESRAGTGE